MSLPMPKKRSASQDWEASSTAKFQRTYEGRRSISAPAQMDLDGSIAILATKFQDMRLGSLFERLPDEIVAQIVQHLAPRPIAIMPGTSILDRQGVRWQAYFTDRANLHSVCLVNRRLNRIATPLIYRSIFISRPTSLCSLFLALLNTPSLGSLVRHLSSAVPLEAEGTIRSMSTAWEPLQSLYRHGLSLSDPEMAAKYHPFTKLLAWLAWSASRGPNHHKFPSVIFCATLCLANRLESLDFFSSAPKDMLQRPPLWNWFLDDDHPFADSDMSIPSGIMNSPATTDNLLDSPRWPPPFLRDVTVECSSVSTGSTFIDLDIVPHADALQHASVLRSSGLKTENPVELLRPSAIQQLEGTEHSALQTYLDGLKRIPDIEYAEPDVHEHIEALKSLTYSPIPPDIDHGAARQLARTVKLLPLSWLPRLGIRSKKVNMPLYDFLCTARGFNRIENTITMANVHSLTLRADCFDSGSSSELERREMASGRTNLQHRLLREGTIWQCLERLHLFLRTDCVTSFSVYPRDGRIRTLDRLVRLKELSVTTEGLFGGTDALGKMFGCHNFIDMPPADVFWPTPQEISDGSLQHDDGESLQQVVDELPPQLEALRVLDWYGQYLAPKHALPVRVTAKNEVRRDMDWIARLAELQQAVVGGLSKLAPVLKARRPALKHFVFWIHKWNVPEADEIWTTWCRSKDGLKRLRREYRKAGIELRVVVRGEGSSSNS